MQHSSGRLKLQFEMFEKCKTGTADGLVIRWGLRDHQGGPGTGLALGLDLAGRLRPQDDRGLGGSGVFRLGVLQCSEE